MPAAASEGVGSLCWFRAPEGNATNAKQRRDLLADARALPSCLTDLCWGFSYLPERILRMLFLP